MPITSISLRGFVVGPIWSGAECFKPLDYSCTDMDARWSEPGTLREHVLRATNDGDFQNCTIALGYLRVEVRRGSRTIIRTFDLAKFPSIADCLHPDGNDWCPQFEGEDDYFAAA